ncbi:hypothetical protein ACJJTC_001672 [Scirpophaga incertulas]
MRSGSSNASKAGVTELAVLSEHNNAINILTISSCTVCQFAIQAVKSLTVDTYSLFCNLPPYPPSTSDGSMRDAMVRTKHSQGWEHTRTTSRRDYLFIAALTDAECAGVPNKQTTQLLLNIKAQHRDKPTNCVDNEGSSECQLKYGHT